jgi:ATP phosphoribosyltransferase
MQRIADSALTQALLGAEAIESKGLKVPIDGVLARVENVFRSRNTVYIHYRIENHTMHPFRAGLPRVYELQIAQASISITSIVRTQLSDKTMDKLGRTSAVALPVALTQNDGQDIAPGTDGQGVIAIRRDMNSPKVLRLEFDPKVKATFVF